MGLALVIAALVSRTLSNPNASPPSRAQDVSVAPLHDPMNRQTSSTDQSGSPAPPVPLVASFGGPPSVPPHAPAGSKPSVASGNRSAASTPTTGPAARLTTSGPPVPTVVAPADRLTVWVVNRASGQHFGVAADSDGALIVQSTSAGSAQQWRLVAASGNCYQLANVHSGKALDNPGGSGANGTQMQQWTLSVGNQNQIWCFQSVGSGHYSIRNSASGSLLDVQGGVSGDGVAIQEWSADPAAPDANQTWQLILVG
jgi:hypothetical protein